MAEHQSPLSQDIHKQLEEKISEFHGTEDTILYPSCFDANAALFEALLTAEDAVISDKLNHASIIDGIRLCKAERHRCVRTADKRGQNTSSFNALGSRIWGWTFRAKASLDDQCRPQV